MPDELLERLRKFRTEYFPAHRQEFTSLIQNGQIFRDLPLGVHAFDPEEDRAMMCGSMAMIQDVAALMEKAGLEEGSNASPGDYVIERAFVG